MGIIIILVKNRVNHHVVSYKKVMCIFRLVEAIKRLRNITLKVIGIFIYGYYITLVTIVEWNQVIDAAESTPINILQDVNILIKLMIINNNQRDFVAHLFKICNFKQKLIYLLNA